MTFSIVAWDPAPAAGREWGVAVASKFLAAGSIVPWARAGVGAVATQALANPRYGPDGLDLLAAGTKAQAVVDTLIGADEQRQHRQVGVVDAGGRAATYTGPECLDWAGGTSGEGYCCQGNILTGPEVISQMAASFEAAAGDLATRLLEALAAGDRAGGDRRGRQSAALLVVREGGGYLGGSDVAVDLRVDDHPDPVGELRRLFDLHRLLFPRPEELDFVEVDDELADELRAKLARLGYRPGEGPGYDRPLREALFAFAGTENLEERWKEGPVIERWVLRHLRDMASRGGTRTKGGVVSDFPSDEMELTHILVVEDPARSRVWYEHVLGATLFREYGGTSVVLQFLGGWLLLVTGGEPTVDKPGVTFAPPADPATVGHAFTIRVPDCATAYETLRQRGAEFLTPPHDWGGEIRGFFRDPDGHLFEISQAT